MHYRAAVLAEQHHGHADDNFAAAIARSSGRLTRPGSPWTDSFVFACLRGRELHRLTFRDGAIVADQRLLHGRYGRLRAVVEGPRGDLYVLTSNRDGRGSPSHSDDRILRITPPRF